MSTGSGSNTTEVVVKLGPNEKLINKSKQFALIERTDKATKAERAFTIRGTADTFTFDFTSNADAKDDPTFGEFPVSAPGYKNMNSTLVTFHHGNGSMTFSIASFDEVAKPGALKPAEVTAGFDDAQKRAIEDPGYTVGRKTDDNIAGSQGRTVGFTGTREAAKVAGTVWLAYAAKANSMIAFEVLAPLGDPAQGAAEAMLKALTITK